MEPASQNRLSFDTIAIVGVGLLGGSIGAAAKANQLARKVVGIGRNQRRLDAAQSAGLVDSVSTDFEVRDADLIIVCTPVDLISDIVRAAATAAKPGTLITDVGSIKSNICRNLDGSLPEGVTFIGSHPIAGSEKQGYEHADAALFNESVCVITPHASTPEDEVRRLTTCWQTLGATVVELSPDEHDQALAATSHLPHVVAAALSGSLNETNRQFAASGFRDTTRIAAGNPELWSAILLNNGAAVLDSLDTFSVQLASLRHAIENREGETLQNLLRNAKTNRDELS